MPFVFEEGEAINVGSQGQNDIAYAAGDPIPDTGRSNLVFEAGVGLGADILGWWPLDDSSGPVEDIGRGGHDGGVFGSPTFGVSGVDGTAIGFEKSDFEDGIVVDHSYQLSEFTVAVWAYAESLITVDEYNSGANPDVIWECSGLDTRLEHEPPDDTQDDPNEIVLEFTIPDTTISSNTTVGLTPSLSNPPAGSWFHTACTYDGTTATLYIDGSPVESESASGWSGNFNGPFSMAQSPNANQYWDGKLDDFRLYDRALSNSEVSALYSSY